MMKPLTLFLLCCAASAVGCSSHAASKGSAAVNTQWSGAFSDHASTTTRVVKTQPEWDALWQQARREPPRALNATREMAVAVFLGERRTGGYTVEIVSTAEKGGKFVIEYREFTPPPDMMVTQALTQPWAIAAVPRSDLPVVFQKLPAAPQPRRE